MDGSDVVLDGPFLFQAPITHRWTRTLPGLLLGPQPTLWHCVELWLIIEDQCSVDPIFKENGFIFPSLFQPRLLSLLLSVCVQVHSPLRAVWRSEDDFRHLSLPTCVCMCVLCVCMSVWVGMSLHREHWVSFSIPLCFIAWRLGALSFSAGLSS